MDHSELLAVKRFLTHNFRHFNAATVIDAAQGYVDQLKANNSMMVTLAGAMSTAELGITLAEMIRQNKVHAISCTAANLEEDIFNLVAHEHYVRLKNWRAITAKDDEQLREKGLNRVTDTCIPEEEAIRKLADPMIAILESCEAKGQRLFPYEWFYKLLDSKAMEKSYETDPKNSWVLAAKEKNLPIFTPGYEDSTLGNIYVASVIKKQLKNINVLKSGFEQMEALVSWYQENTQKSEVGFFQIGGGIAGDFPICVVPLLEQDLEINAKKWSYFCQIGDSTTSYGSYSGAFPNEKISWGKLKKDTPAFMIESDATIVAPLIFAYVLASD